MRLAPEWHQRELAEPLGAETWWNPFRSLWGLESLFSFFLLLFPALHSHHIELVHYRPEALHPIIPERKLPKP